MLCLLLLSLQVNAIDVVKVSTAQSQHSVMFAYKNEVVKRCLVLTEATFGPYEYHVLDVSMNRRRALISLINGAPNNIYIAPGNKEWDEKTLPIAIPIRQGLLSYRLLLVNKEDVAKFSAVNTLDDLKQLTAGLRSGWVTADIFKQLAFKTEISQTFEGLFLLLQNRRFDYLPRSVYEIYDDLAQRPEILANVVIEPTLALLLPMPTYIYVSPKEPRLAKRLEAGLKLMVNNGELQTILTKHYGEAINKAKLKDRKMIEIPNPYFTLTEELKNSPMWLKL